MGGQPKGPTQDDGATGKSDGDVRVFQDLLVPGNLQNHDTDSGTFHIWPQFHVCGQLADCASSQTEAESHCKTIAGGVGGSVGTAAGAGTRAVAPWHTTPQPVQRESAPPLGGAAPARGVAPWRPPQQPAPPKPAPPPYGAAPARGGETQAQLAAEAQGARVLHRHLALGFVVCVPSRNIAG